MNQIFAFDAFLATWQGLHNLTEERGDHLPHFGVALAGTLLASAHVNLLEIETALSLMRYVAQAGHSSCPIAVLTDSRLALGALAKGRSSSRRISFRLKKGVFLRAFGMVNSSMYLEPYLG